MRRGAPARRPVAAPSSAPSSGMTPEQAAVRAWVRLLAVHKRGLAAIRDDLEREMTLPRFDLLANLVRSDGQTLASLSRSMLVTAGNLTGLVDRAARDGLVERRSDPNDRRAWRVHITPKGTRAFHEAERRHAQKVARVFAGLAGPEMETLIHLLDKVKATLRDADPEPQKRRLGLSPRKTKAQSARPSRRVATAAHALEDKKKRTP
ncbi:MAG: MarR family transcriptional regulator [Polyangiaceae bacterium]